MEQQIVGDESADHREDQHNSPPIDDGSGEEAAAHRELLPKFHHGGYAYVKDRMSADGTKIFWRCEKKSAPNPCNGRVWTNAEDVEPGDSLTNAILGILPPQQRQQIEAGDIGENSNKNNNGRPKQEQQRQQKQQQHGQAATTTTSSGSAGAGMPGHHAPGPFPDQLHNQQKGGGAGAVGQLTWNTMAARNNHHQQQPFGAADQLSHQQKDTQHVPGNLLPSRKRRAMHPQQQQHMMMNGFGGEDEQGTESVELRLKRLKCELIEKQLLEMERQEEWRLKQEFLMGRQTAAMENIVIQLRQIKEKLK